MLILTRNKGQSVRVSIDGKEMHVVYLGVNDFGQAKFGFVAPPEVKILRSELRDLESDEQV